MTQKKQRDKISAYKNFVRMIGLLAAVSVSVPSHGDFALNGARRAAEPTSTKNTKPVANDDAVALKNSATAFNVLANDFDKDGDRLVIVEASAQFGAVIFTADGLIGYAQNPGSPRADNITYIATDGRGGFVTGLVAILVE